MSSVGCSQCAAGCDSAAHMTIHDATNAVKSGPAIFEVCSAACATFEFDGTTCTPIGSTNGMSCTVANDELEFDVTIHEIDRVSVYVNVSKPNAMPGDPLIFQGFTDVDTTPFEVCGQECHEADVEFTIPPQP